MQVTDKKDAVALSFQCVAVKLTKEGKKERSRGRQPPTGIRYENECRTKSQSSSERMRLKEMKKDKKGP